VKSRLTYKRNCAGVYKIKTLIPRCQLVNKENNKQTIIAEIRWSLLNMCMFVA